MHRKWVRTSNAIAPVNGQFNGHDGRRYHEEPIRLEDALILQTSKIPATKRRKPTPRNGVRYVRSLDKVEHLSPGERERLQEVAETYAFRANDYYLGLINWDDPDDPIRRIVIPSKDELGDWGQLDASNEKAITVTRGAQHKYFDTALLLCNEVCGAYCRYCFRKRLFMNGNGEASTDVSAGLEYIAANPQINNVLLTGGDPLLMSPRRLGDIFAALKDIPHVKIIRVGSKMPAFDPWRMLGNKEMQAVFREFSTPKKRIYLMAHFDHPRELTRAAVAGIARFIESGVICCNQCPLIGGVNDDPDVLAELYAKLSYIGCPPYYLFQGRPTAGNEPYEVPLVQGFQIYDEAHRRGSGLARRARFCMSHSTGKIQVLHIDERYIYLKYHQAKDPKDLGRFMVCHRDDDAYWFDQLRPVDEFGG